MTVGDRIKYYREEKHLSQRNVADRLGYASQTVFKYEKGIVSEIPLTVIERIADVLEISPAVLCGWETGDDIRFANALSQLNDAGRERAADYVEDLVASGRYKKASVSEMVG